MTPFGAVKNINLQGFLLIIAGFFAWVTLTFKFKILRSLPTTGLIFLILFGLTSLLSAVLNPHLGYDLFGAPYIRLGALGLLACAGCGLLIAWKTPLKQLQIILYAAILALALLSIPYSLLRFHSLLRDPGLFAQADIMACFLGVGIILGLGLLKAYPSWRFKLLAGQFVLLALLWLTETRAALFLVIIIGLVWQFVAYPKQRVRRMAMSVVAVAILLAVLVPLTPDRVSNVSYASTSITYRLSLQKDALRSSFQKPLLGYGPGNLVDALTCSKLDQAALQKTCAQGYFFNSSHNVFLDRVLAIGWLGGLAYLGFAVFGLWRSLRADSEVRVLGFAALFIAFYYLTNVTSVTLEVLFWILLMSCLLPANRASASR